MRLLILILITFVGVFELQTAQAGDCEGDRTIILTSPQTGAKTMFDAITVRGFLCENFPLIEVRNETTDRSTTTMTTEVCDRHECTYEFAVPVRSLVLGTNQIRALIPGEDPPIEVKLDVVRTAFAAR